MIFIRFKNIFSTVLLIVRAKKIWRRPKKKYILIYDKSGAEVLMHYLDAERTEILATRGEVVNMYVLIKKIFSIATPKKSYFNLYIKYVEPSVIITFIDNTPSFYQLKNEHPGVTTLFVQNGSRGGSNDVFKILSRNLPEFNANCVDYMLTFNKAVGDEYAQYIDGSVCPIGSFKNNFVSLYRGARSHNTVVFISQFRDFSCLDSRYLNTAYFQNFYDAENILLPFLSEYCRDNGLVLQICGAAVEQMEKEQQFFHSILGNHDWIYLSRNDLYSSYKHIDAAEYIVFIDSTLGYESLSRGNKTVAFTIRGKTLFSNELNFGWPSDFPERGPFWTNIPDESDFKYLMDYITAVSDEEWREVCEKFVPDVIKYDEGNVIFIQLMQKLGVPLNDVHCENYEKEKIWKKNLSEMD